MVFSLPDTTLGNAAYLAFLNLSKKLDLCLDSATVLDSTGTGFLETFEKLLGSLYAGGGDETLIEILWFGSFSCS